MMLDETMQGSLPEAHVRNDYVQRMGPDVLRSLGKVRLTLYLGEAPLPIGDDAHGEPTLAPYYVYDVEFENGERLCAIRKRSDGLVDGFVCA
jgi:hypothetical protein